MRDRLGIVADLLETIARLSAQSFHLVDGTGCSLRLPSSSARLSDAQVRLLEEQAGQTGRAGLVRAEDGTCACGIPVTLRPGGRHLLVAQTDESARGNADRGTDMRHLVGHIKQLIEERQEAEDESRRLTEELNQAYEELYLFARIASQLRSLRFSVQMLRDLLREICEAMRVELAAAYFDGREEDNMEVTCTDLSEVLPARGEFVRRLRMEMPRSAPAFEEHCHIVNRSSELPAFRAMHPKEFRVLAVPIESGDRKYGWLLLVSFNMKEIFRRGEYQLLRSMAEQIALVIANSELYRDLEHFVINLVKSLVMTIDAKDVYTKGHSERVSEYCMQIAQAMKLDEKQRFDLQWASMLHDLGKIGTPGTILNKPDRLSDEEHKRITAHPAKGAEILQPINQLENALPAIRHHHERYDGKGYPDGLKGEAIPLLARIIAVADAFDAMTSDRAYRAALSRPEAMRSLTEGAGSQFDPRIVDVFRKAAA